MARITEKTAQFLAFVASNPGCNTAELHRTVGQHYAHGHHKYTYATINRMLRRGLVVRCPAVSGRGAGLRAAVAS